MRLPAAIALGLALGFSPPTAGRAQSREDYENAPVRYSETTPRDAAAKIEQRLAAGRLVLSGSDRDVVAQLLREFGVSPASQVVVFSKTSFQRDRITPSHPRAIYFSDTCYLGWVPGGLIEVTTIDPQLGPVFYSFDPSRKAGATGARFVRDPDCLRCHGGAFVREVPGVFVRSVFPDSHGEPLLRHGTTVVDHRTPFADRWGGWYVTGRHGEALHRGNVLGREEGDQLVFDPRPGANLTDLSTRFDPTKYLATTSDIVALLVLEYQTSVQNVLTHAAFSTRRMLDYQRGLQRNFKEPETDQPTYDSVKSVFESESRAVVDALLFKDEAPLPAGLEGSPAYVQAYAGGVPATPAGDSLRQLSLDGHLLRNRCSSLIYSEMFLGLPAPLKQRIYARLAEALRTDGAEARYAYLGREEKARIAEILRRTHPDLQTGWAPRS